MTPEERAALNRAISRLFDRWQVGDETGSRILAMDLEHYRSWRLAQLDRPVEDLELRLSLLLGIHVQLCTFFKDPKRGYAWMSRSNDLFGQSPLEMLATGDIYALARLRAYLAAETEAPL